MTMYPVLSRERAEGSRAKINCWFWMCTAWMARSPTTMPATSAQSWCAPAASRAGSMALLAAGAHQLWALVAGIVVGDLAIQAVHIQNQQLIFALEPSARSRLNTGYMVIYFVGGAIGSATTGLAYGTGGWPAVIVLGAGYSGAALVLWICLL